MDLEMNKKAYKKKKMNPKRIAIGFLVFSILLTGGLYAYNTAIENENILIEKNIIAKQDSIEELESNSKIVASSLYNSNINSIKKLEDYSKISFYVKHLLELQRKYRLNFKGFKYSSGKLTTQVIAGSDSYGVNYLKVVNFIEKYRENKDLSALFDLELVKTIDEKNNGQDYVFSINLSLKNNIGAIFKKAEEKKEEMRKAKIKAEEKKEEIRKAKTKAITDKIKALKQKQLETSTGTTNTGSVNSEIN